MDVHSDLIQTLFGNTYLTADQRSAAIAMAETDALVSRKAIARLIRNIISATIREDLSGAELFGLRNRIASALRVPLSFETKPPEPTCAICESSRENGIAFLRLSTSRGESFFFTCPEPIRTHNQQANGSFTNKVEPVSLAQIDATLDAADQRHELPRHIRTQIRNVWAKACGL